MRNSAFITRHLCLLAVTNQSVKQQRAKQKQVFFYMTFFKAACSSVLPLWSGVEGKLLRDDASFLLLVLLLPLLLDE